MISQLDYYTMLVYACKFVNLHSEFNSFYSCHQWIFNNVRQYHYDTLAHAIQKYITKHSSKKDTDFINKNIVKDF